MGLSIKEAIPILHDMYNYYNDTDIDAYVGFDKEANNAMETALDTMRKYKQIEEIIKSWKDGTLEEKDSVYAFHEIMEVVEDGLHT